MTTNFDHIVIAADSLEQGVSWLKEKFGMDIPVGGEHPLMGTHNHVMQLGDGAYLEVIAINPTAPAPTRPRWFSLDDPFIRTRLAQEPLLLTWVINTSDVTRLQAQTDFPFGIVEPMHRGDLRWLFTIPQDGQMPAAGFLPTIIQWQSSPHPSGRMADLGCRLQRLTIHHPRADWLTEILTAIDAAHLVTVESLSPNDVPYFTLEVTTPQGAVRLVSRVG